MAVLCHILHISLSDVYDMDIIDYVEFLKSANKIIEAKYSVK